MNQETEEEQTGPQRIKGKYKTRKVNKNKNKKEEKRTNKKEKLERKSIKESRIAQLFLQQEEKQIRKKKSARKNIEGI